MVDRQVALQSCDRFLPIKYWDSGTGAFLSNAIHLKNAGDGGKLDKYVQRTPVMPGRSTMGTSNINEFPVLSSKAIHSKNADDVESLNVWPSTNFLSCIQMQYVQKMQVKAESLVARSTVNF